MAALFASALKHVGQVHKADDDFIDRLNHRFTVILLVTFTTFVSAKQFIGEPISCWTPGHFSAPQVLYTNSICWLKGTYYLEADRRSIPHPTQNSEFHIAYYQFVPYMLLVMAALFYLPHMLWRNMSRYSGFDLRSIIETIKVLNTDIDKVASQIHIALQYNSPEDVAYHDKPLKYLLKIFQPLRQYRNFLSFLYTFVKILYIINCSCQFYLLTQFLSFPFHNFGYEWLLTMAQKVHTRTNSQSNDSKWFPRVVMCDFMVRHLGSNQHGMAVQCNLPINLFNELIFLILWAWFIFLSGLTCISFILCLISIYTNLGHAFVRKYLHMSLLKFEEEEEDEFIEDYLRSDGILVLRIIAQNTNDIIMANLVGCLFKRHRNLLIENNDDQIQSTGCNMCTDHESI